MTDTYSGHCELAHGGSIRACGCRIKPWSRLNGGGWLKCPPQRVTVVEHVHVGPLNGGATATVEKSKPSARSMGFTGDLCDSCGSFAVVRNGTCTLCRDCGATSGCS